MGKYKLSIYYQNVRGLRTKTTTFRRNVGLENFDIIALTETWLNDNITDSELVDDRYTVWRRDRKYDVTGQSKGGGTYIAVRKEFHAFSRPDWCSSAEDLWITFQLGKERLHLCVIYLCDEMRGFTFSQQLSNFLTKLQDIVLANPSDIFLVCGDFNMSKIHWNLTNPSEYLKPSNSSAWGSDETDFIDEINFMDLHQYNYVTNKYGRILDLVLCNYDTKVDNITSPLVPLDPHHNALCVTLSSSHIEPLRPAPRTKYIFQRANFDAFNIDLSKINWQQDFSNLNLDDSVDYFYKVLENLRDKYVPSKFIRKRIYPPWYSSALIKVLKEKYKHFTKYKIYGMLNDKQSVDILRDRANRLEESCYKCYINNVENSIKDNPKHFWRYFKSKKISLPSVLTYGNNSSSSGIQICNYFADYFHSTFLPPNPNHVPSSNLDSACIDADICSISITESLIKSKLTKLDTSKSAGPDSIPAILLIKCADQLSIPLQILFTRSIREGYMPIFWKRAFITPIYKKGPKNQVINYRPISKLCIIAKTFEKIIHEQLYPCVKNSLPISQHGFLKGRSTVSNLILLNDFVTGHMEVGNQVDVVYTDYTKCFDRIDHSILLLKLQNAGIRGDLLRWFASYIKNRSQAVVLQNYMSNWMSVPSGVPQGSLLGPLLFLLFIADIESCFHHSLPISFADDMKIIKSITDVNDCLLLQEDLSRLSNYCQINKLDLNVEKCTIMTFSRKIHPITHSYCIKGDHLNRVNEMKDLGVIHDSKLLFQNHILSIIRKALKSLGFILRASKDFRSLKTFKILYSTYVRCHLEYGSQIWNPLYATYIDSMERVQRKFLRFINFRSSSKETDYLKQCARHHFLPLNKRREHADILYLQKIVTSTIDCPELLNKINIITPSRSLRNIPLFQTSSATTNYRMNSYFFRACNTFNKYNKLIDIDIFATNQSALRRQLGKAFFDAHK